MRALTRAAAIPAALALAAGGLLLATPASATDNAVPVDCAVSQAEIRWGFKEAFRSYISSSIAHGSWEVVDGAGYETPEFIFSVEEGELDLLGDPSELAFPGGIHFTGHNGLLDTRLSNPTLVITGGGATLRMDVSGVSMEDALAGRAEVHTVEQAELVSIDMSGATRTDGSVSAGPYSQTLTVDNAPTVLTEEGFAAFPNYEAGTAFDPISIRVTTECTPAQTATPEPVPTGTATAEPEATATAPEGTVESVGPGVWVWIIVGAVVVAAGALGWVVAATRKRRTQGAVASADDRTGVDAGSGDASSGDGGGADGGTA